MFKLCYSSGGLSLYVCLYFLNKMTSLPEIYAKAQVVNILIMDSPLTSSLGRAELDLERLAVLLISQAPGRFE